MPKPPDPLASAKRIMAQLVRQPPKPHSEMKIGKKNAPPKQRALVKSALRLFLSPAEKPPRLKMECRTDEAVDR
jgi:hypothetical protein